jgi:hypothetical protein
MRTNTLSILLPVLVMALATSSASADPIRHSNGSRFFNNSHCFNGNGYNHYRGYNRNNRFTPAMTGTAFSDGMIFSAPGRTTDPTKTMAGS